MIKSVIQHRYTALIPILVYLFTALCVSAQLQVTEIMYNPSGDDDRREWIEITNTSSTEDLQVSDFLLEDTVRKTIFSFFGDTPLKPKQTAVVVKSRELFQKQFPKYKGTIYTSSFILINTGDRRFRILDQKGQVIDSFRYVSSIGGNGNGNSLHIYEDGGVSEGKPSPGDPNPPNPFEEQKEEETPEIKKNSDVREKIQTPETIFVGVDHTYKVFRNERRLFIQKWNFGDGTKEQKNANHIYKNPGTYRIIASFVSGGRERVVEKNVTVIKPNITLHIQNKEEVEIKNNYSENVDISQWRVIDENTIYTFSKNTTIVKNSSIIIPFSSKNEVVLQTQKGVPIASISKEPTHPNTTIKHTQTQPSQPTNIKNPVMIPEKEQTNKTPNQENKKETIVEQQNTAINEEGVFLEKNISLLATILVILTVLASFLLFLFRRK